LVLVLRDGVVANGVLPTADAKLASGDPLRGSAASLG
jgi:hypothetical protein